MTELDALLVRTEALSASVLCDDEEMLLRLVELRERCVAALMRVDTASLRPTERERLRERIAHLDSETNRLAGLVRQRRDALRVELDGTAHARRAALAYHSGESPRGTGGTHAL